MEITKIVKGKPSTERPWMKYYSEEIQKLEIPECTLEFYLKQRCISESNIAIHYYGRDISWGEFFCQVNSAAKALAALGFGVNDQLPIFLRSVPEFLILLLAAEKIGASLVCRDNLPEENALAVKKTGSAVVFAHDFISQEDVSAIESTGIKKFVLVSPYNYACKETMQPHITAAIESLYNGKTNFSAEIISWNDFIKSGEDYTGDFEALEDIDRPLYCAYTSGSTGASKQVIHSAHTMIGVVHQLNLYGSQGAFRPVWLQTILPPSLVAVVNSMLLMPLASNKLLVMDPFCAAEDIDLEMMKYRPNCWPLIPMFMEILMNSKRIPEDYDISHLMAVGVGAESFNKGQIERARLFLEKHNIKVPLTIGYGLSEIGSNAIFPVASYPAGDGNVGITMPLNNVGIFEAGTENELGYSQLGEICISSPGLMLGYDEKEKTDEVIKVHKDGTRWIHTGDYGYINEDGIIYVYGRGNTQRYGGGYLSEIFMENSVINENIPEVEDAFFVIIDDKKHPGYYEPYLYVILKDGAKIEDIRRRLLAPLKEHEKPVEIFELDKRPFSHFKTDRIGLSRCIEKE